MGTFKPGSEMWPIPGKPSVGRCDLCLGSPYKSVSYETTTSGSSNSSSRSSSSSNSSICSNTSSGDSG